MFCKKCGEKVEDNSKLCQKCQPINRYEDTTEKTNPSNHLGKAGFWIRYLARLIDSFIIVGVIFAIATISFPLFKSNVSATIIEIIILPIFFGYYIFMTYKYQYTLGKRMLGIRVISKKSNKLTLGQVILRETLGKALTLLIAMTGIGFLLMLMIDWAHDIIAKTTVVYKGY